ncbi:MAG: glycoside hydrolase family 43 protein [Myxococcales bacterium]|nr:glycoside hydrolase family 43 protein [Myxococcales bacterium]
MPIASKKLLCGAAIALCGILTLGCCAQSGAITGKAPPLPAVKASQEPEAPHPVARFHWFRYEGQDAVFERPPPPGQFVNPVVAGFYPDPSVVRVAEDYYLVHSSFAYFPGLPLFHSKDLVSWRPIGHAVSRRSQVTFESGQSMSQGLYAPTIRYHDGVFYIVNTDAGGIGNFLLTAEDPAGPWSAPVVLPEIGGVDPDLFFDRNGKVYIAHNDLPEGGARYEGHRAIWLWEFDLASLKVVAGSGRMIVNGGVSLATQPIWIEAPHIYEKDGWYYLLCAEGGTESNHSEVVFRARSLDDRFVPFDENPILTQRNLPPSRAFPIANTGHADLVETPEGDWWAVFLGVRPYRGEHFNTGRETFLLPVRWESGWPRLLEPGTPVPRHVTRPKLPALLAPAASQTGNFRWQDDFDAVPLRFDWLMLRTSPTRWFRLRPELGAVDLTPLPITLSDAKQPAYLGRRQQHGSFSAETELELPKVEGFSAGIAIFQNRSAHYYLGVSKQRDGYHLFVERVSPSEKQMVNEQNLQIDGSIIVGLRQVVDHLEFFYRSPGGDLVPLATGQDATLLSSTVAGGFVGNTVGMHTRLELPR